MEAAEPDPALRSRFTHHTGLPVHPWRAEELAAQGPAQAYGAVVAESVLHGTDLDAALSGVRHVLRPGGVLLFTDMVWTEQADPVQATRLHDESLRRFGIPCASRARWTWTDWRDCLAAHGLGIEQEQLLGPGSPGRAGRPTWRARLVQPRASLWALVYSRRMRRFHVPQGWVESRACLARRDGSR